MEDIEQQDLDDSSGEDIEPSGQKRKLELGSGTDSPSMKLRKSSGGDVIEGTPVDDMSASSSRIWDELQRKKEILTLKSGDSTYSTLQGPSDVEYMSSFTDVINSLARESDLQTSTSQPPKLLSKSLESTLHVSVEPAASQKKLREEKRNKDKTIVKLFVYMLTCETEEVEKSVPSNLQEIVGIEKQKLWDLFQKYLGETHTSAVTPSVFWKYVVGKQRGQYEAPLYSTNEYHKEVLKAGVKRITGVRWRDPLSPTDRDKLESNYNELLKLGIQLDIEMINKELSQLLKQHDDRVKKNPKTLPKVKTGSTKQMTLVSSPPSIQTVGNSQEISSIGPNGMNSADVNNIVNALQPIVNQLMINTTESAQLSGNSTTIIDSNQLQQLLMLMSQLLQALQSRPS